MKKYNQFILAALLVLSSLFVKAQSSTIPSYFEGKWNILLKGLPDGDTKMYLILQKKDTTWSGVVQDSTGTEISKVDKFEMGEATATVYFSARGYDVNLVMNKKDDDHITGTLMGMFDAVGDRVKENK
jgi:hypothetical protein